MNETSCNSLPVAPTALVILAEGAEEMETVIIIDILRRAGVNDAYIIYYFILH